MEELKPSFRSFHLDLVKFISICLLPVVHVFSMTLIDGLAAPGFPPQWLTEFLALLYNIGPTGFLIPLGCAVVLTRHNSPEELARRGARTIGMGLTLNFFRFTLVYLILGLCLGDAAVLMRAWTWLIGSDVLPFAGMTFLVFAGVRKWHLPDWAVLAIGAGCAVGQMLLPVPNMPGTLGHLLGNLIFVEGGESYFPLLSWLIFPCLGYVYQSRLQKTRDPKRFHMLLGVSSALLLAATVALLRRAGKWKRRYLLWGEMDFHMDMVTTWIVSLISALFLSLTWPLANWLKKCPVRKPISSLAKRMTSFYCIHWLLLMGAILWSKLRRRTPPIRRVRDYWAAVAGIFTVAAMLSKLWAVFRTSKRS